MSGIEQCPQCGVDLRDGRPRLGRQETRTIGVYVREIYIGVLFWRCPDCGHAWQRWPPGDRLHTAAAPYVD